MSFLLVAHILLLISIFFFFFEWQPLRISRVPINNSRSYSLTHISVKKPIFHSKESSILSIKAIINPFLITSHTANFSSLISSTALSIPTIIIASQIISPALILKPENEVYSSLGYLSFYLLLSAHLNDLHFESLS